MTVDELCNIINYKIDNGEPSFRIHNVNYTIKYNKDEIVLNTDNGYRLVKNEISKNWNMHFKEILILSNSKLDEVILYAVYKPWVVELYSSLKSTRISFTEIVNNKTIFTGGSGSVVENTLNLIGTILYACITNEEIHYIEAYDNNNIGDGLADMLYCGKTIECKRLKSKQMFFDKLKKSIGKANIFMGFMSLDTFNACGPDIFSGVKKYDYDDIVIIGIQTQFMTKKLSLTGEIESLVYGCRLKYICNMEIIPVYKKNTPVTMNDTTDNEPEEYIGEQVILNIAIGHKLISATLKEKILMSDGVNVIDIGNRIIHGFGDISTIILGIEKARRLEFKCHKICAMHSIKEDGRAMYKINLDRVNE